MNNGDGLFTHNMPQFGFFRINQDKLNHLKLSDPPNDKKRHDPLHNLNLEKLIPTVNNQRNILEVMQIYKPEKDPYKYVCGIFLVMNYEPHDLINYVKNYQLVIPFERGLEIIRKRFAKPGSVGPTHDDECEIFCSDLKLELKCNIT